MNHYHAHHYTSETHHKQDIYYLTNSYNGTLCWKVTQTIWLLQYTVTARKYVIIFHTLVEIDILSRQLAFPFTHCPNLTRVCSIGC